MSEEIRETKQRLLDAAEALFAERGFAATSLRAITARAGVNLAAVNYHFGSKDALLRAVYARRLVPVNQQRLALLTAAVNRAGRRRPSLEAILEAFIAPALRLHGEMAEQVSNFQRLMGRLLTEPGEWFRELFQEQFAEVAASFCAALEKALPRLPRAELYWRIHFATGAIAHTLAGTHLLHGIMGERYDRYDAAATVWRLVAFLAAGLRAPLRSTASARSRKS